MNIINTENNSTFIDVLMATHNGEKYIIEQIDSIVDQITSVKFRLIISDDGSSDNTLDLIKAKSKNCNKCEIILLPQDGNNLGPVKRFELLIKYSNAPYIMLSDQDDVWLPEKINKSFNKILELEASAPDKPALVFTDLIAFEDQNISLDSMFKRNHLNNPEDIKKLLIRNTANGCTMIFNKHLRDVALPFPIDIYMHDWWLALAAAYSGNVLSLKVATALYRQHSGNVVGIGERNRLRRILALLTISKIKQDHKTSVEQAIKLRDRIIERHIPLKHGIILKEYCSINDYNGIRRKIRIFKNNFLTGSLIFKILFLFII